MDKNKKPGGVGAREPSLADQYNSSGNHSTNASVAQCAGCGIADATGAGSLAQDGVPVSVRYRVCPECSRHIFDEGNEAEHILHRIAFQAIALARRFMPKRSRSAEPT
jgi:hypothetical protein